MPKVALKERLRTVKGDLDALNGTPLPDEHRLYDTDRITPKADGGTYEISNTRLLLPVSHMERHGNLRLRDERLEELKAVIDDREQVRKSHQKILNQLLAYQRRTDHLNESTAKWLEEESASIGKILANRSSVLSKLVTNMAAEDSLMASALGVIGIGPVSVAYLTAYIDLEKARHASSVWAYCGYDKPSHSRYEKGVAGGGNKTLRTVLYTTVDSMMKNRECPYRLVYDQVKSRLSLSEKITMSRNTQGKLVEVAWKDAKPSHRHGAALRAMAKHLLADYWFVGRTLRGLPTTPLYVNSQLGHEGAVIQPELRGWTI